MKMRVNILFIVLLVLSVQVFSSLAGRSVPRDKELKYDIKRDEIDLTPGLSIDEEPSHMEQDCIRFLIQNMPVTDHMSLRYTFLHNQAHYALKARVDNPWASAVPWDVFLNNVLPYANLDEPREDWRTSFYELFSPLVANTASTLDAATALNNKIWTLGDWNISFKAGQTPDIMSPSQVLSHGYASCTGLAIFFVDACRAVGIPARVAGIAEWTETGGNHNWVEVWHNGVWSFTEPLGFPNRPWNQTWFFPEPVRRAKLHSYAHGIYAASFNHTGHFFPLAWRDEYESTIPGYEVTKYYLDAAAEAGLVVACDDGSPLSVEVGQGRNPGPDVAQPGANDGKEQ
ncbi:hypothetical protein Vretimale_2445 [Volvox reticuliferus]|uniref:Uncharacterized protein n=1 Tax=Volvox reticuliferus TaxID=1737510 RepID=A0A8J4G2Y7_9CHLO|nr:hypothetical protein Vretifemale_4745 [Volvox reticuliferus]GIL96688.1 hypothetical protein Vretimale_2445 [Volvox reticuliferus]